MGSTRRLALQTRVQSFEADQDTRRDRLYSERHRFRLSHHSHGGLRHQRPHAQHEAPLHTHTDVSLNAEPASTTFAITSQGRVTLNGAMSTKPRITKPYLSALNMVSMVYHHSSQVSASAIHFIQRAGERILVHHKTEFQEYSISALKPWRSQSLDLRLPLLTSLKKALEITSRRRAFTGRKNCLAFETNWAILSQHSGISAGVGYSSTSAVILRIAAQIRPFVFV